MATRTITPGPLSAPADVATPVAARSPTRTRVDSVDLLRGLVMVIMLLDHTRDYVHRDALVFDPTDLSRTSVLLFFTRWITHFCAPVFVFLAGTGAALQLARGKTKAELSRFLFTRGLWLAVLELTVVRLVVTFDLHYAAFAGMLQVIFAIGVAMMVLAGLLYLPTRWVAAIGIAIVAGHNLLDGIRVPPNTPPGALGSLWMVLHQPGFVVLGPVRLLVLYPVLPWIGILLCGYALGQVYTWDAERRRRLLVRLGAGLVAAFVAIRLTNLYGEPNPWSVQKSAAFTVLSFLNVTKYPPSLLYTVMTLGPALLFLAWAEAARRGPLGNALVTFGRVPLFYYVGQWVAAHGIALLLSLAFARPTSHLFGLPGFTPPRPGAGFSLGVAYLCWLAGALLLYPACRWFAGVKRRRDDWWLSYL